MIPTEHPPYFKINIVRTNRDGRREAQREILCDDDPQPKVGAVMDELRKEATYLFINRASYNHSARRYMAGVARSSNRYIPSKLR